MCSDALDDEPECLPLLLIRARAQIALRRDLDAQGDLRDIIRLDPACGTAYRLLGVLAARRDENGPAGVFFREAIRLDPGDREAHDWLLIVDAPLRSAAAGRPAHSPAGRAPERLGDRPIARTPERQVDRPVERQVARPVARPAERRPEPAAQPRLARGTQTRDDLAPVVVPGGYEERPTKPFARGSDRDGDAWRTPVARPAARQMPQATPRLQPNEPPRPTLTGHPPTQPPAKEAPRLAPRSPMRSATRSAIPELPGFGEYLVTSGILSRDRLRAAQAYQRSMKVQLSTAIVTLGLATPQRIEWAAVAHQSQLARERQLQ